MKIDTFLLLINLKTALIKRGFYAEVLDDKVYFSVPSGFTTHTGENQFKGSRIFRSGTISVSSLLPDKVRIVRKTDYYGLIVLLVCITLLFLMIGMFQNSINGILFIVLLWASVIFLILLVGINSYKDTFKAMISQSLEELNIRVK